MKVMVVYDSTYGNTGKIAEAIAGSVSDGNDVRLVNVREVLPGEVRETPILIVGSPTHGGRPTPEIARFLDDIDSQDLVDTFVASFDTRFSQDSVGRGLRFLMRVIGYAAEKIEKKLSEKGGELAAESMGFIVTDNEGPLRDGETERASEWGRRILGYVSSMQPESITK